MHHIIGDVLYGPGAAVGKNAPASERLMLHAATLEFDDPGTGERVRFERRPEF